MVKYIKSSFDRSLPDKQRFINYCKGKVADLGEIDVYFCPTFDFGDDYGDYHWEYEGKYYIVLEYPDDNRRDYKYIVESDYQGDETIIDENGHTNTIFPIGFSLMDELKNMEFTKIDTVFYNYCIDNWERLSDLL